MEEKAKRFHKKIGFPKEISLPSGRLKLKPTNHAQERAIERNVEIPNEIYVHQKDIIEVETKYKKLHKYVVQIPYNDEHVLGIVIDTSGNRVVTVWKNPTGHERKDMRKYSQPSEF